MRRVLIDTAVFSYALGGDHAYREPCRRIVDMASEGQIRVEASADLLQELANQRLRRTGDRDLAVEHAQDAGRVCRLLDLRGQDATRALELFGAHERLSARDAVFAAVALGRGIDAILSTDRAFDDVRGLERIDPADEAAVESLTA